MASKNSIAAVPMLVYEHFLVPFFLTLTVPFLVIYLFDFKFLHINKDASLLLGLTSAAFVFWIRQNAWLIKITNYRYFNHLNGTAKYILYLLLLLIFADIFFLTSDFVRGIYLEKYATLSAVINSLYIPTVLLAYFSVWINRFSVEHKIQQDFIKPTKRTTTIVLLFVIIAIFVSVKYPYAGNDFSGYYDMKYSSYVEPAMHMLEYGPLHNERRYQALPVILDDGIFNTFGYYPLMEWGLYGTYELFPSNSLEFNTRLFTTFLGALLLISIYYFLRHFQGNLYIFCVLLLLVLNTVIQFFTYVTVYDVFLLIFFFWSLHLLLKGLDTRSNRIIYFAGIVAGIGINLKYSLLVFLAPAAFLLLLLYKRAHLKDFIINSILFAPNLLLQTVYFRISIRYLPENPLLFGGFFAVLVGLNIYFSRYADTIAGSIQKLFDNPFSRKILVSVTVAAIFFAALAVITIVWIGKFLVSNFVTDQYLIFNWKMYSAIFFTIKTFLTPTLFYLGIFLLPTVLFLRNKRLTLLSIVFLAASLVYLIVASKVLYFHTYYLHLFMITGVILSITSIYYLSKIYNKYFGYLLVSIVVLSTLPVSLGNIDEYLSKKRENVIPTAEYLKMNLSDDEYFMFNEIPTAITLYADRKSFSEDTLAGLNEDGSLRDIFMPELSRTNDVTDVMRNHKIKYYVINQNYGFSKVGFASLFSDDIYNKLDSISFRTRLILCESNSECAKIENSSEIDEIFQNKVAPYLSLEKQIGDYQIYRFVAPSI